MVVLKGSGGFVQRDMNGMQELLKELLEEVVHIVQERRFVKIIAYSI